MKTNKVKVRRTDVTGLIYLIAAVSAVVIAGGMFIYTVASNWPR